jgi:hypothetical protein
MEHKPLSELDRLADLKGASRPSRLSKRERLERWAERLEAAPDRILSTLEEIEWQPLDRRLSLRADNSPLSVAFADPLLREEGLASDRLGDAMDFFELTEHEAHTILCSCNGGESIEAGEAARRLRLIRSPKLWTLYVR